MVNFYCLSSENVAGSSGGNMPSPSLIKMPISDIEKMKQMASENGLTILEHEFVGLDGNYTGRAGAPGRTVFDWLFGMNRGLMGLMEGHADYAKRVSDQGRFLIPADPKGYTHVLMGSNFCLYFEVSAYCPSEPRRGVVDFSSFDVSSARICPSGLKVEAAVTRQRVSLEYHGFALRDLSGLQQEIAKGRLVESPFVVDIPPPRCKGLVTTEARNR